jgi:hypothetical protein
MSHATLIAPALKRRRRSQRVEEGESNFYRVNLLLLNTFNNLTGLLGTAKFL